MSEPLDDLMGNALTEPIVRDDGEEIEVSVVDDMPEGDQPAARAGNKGAGESVEELDSLGGRTQRRIKKLQYDYHEERRSIVFRADARGGCAACTAVGLREQRPQGSHSKRGKSSSLGD